MHRDDALVIAPRLPFAIGSLLGSKAHNQWLATLVGMEFCSRDCNEHDMSVYDSSHTLYSSRDESIDHVRNKTKVAIEIDPDVVINKLYGRSIEIAKRGMCEAECT